MLTISVNHARLRRMPLAADPHQIREAEAYYEKYRDLSACFEKRQAELLAQGMPWPKIEPAVREEMGIVPCAENMLPVSDPYFTDVQVIRMLENTESIERILIHEIGHMLSEESGAVNMKKIKKLFTRCRDGFEDLYEFCAECFMASEMTAGAVRDGQPVVIPLAQQVREILDGYMK
jgi:hypothetical protein